MKVEKRSEFVLIVEPEGGRDRVAVAELSRMLCEQLDEFLDLFAPEVEDGDDE